MINIPPEKSGFNINDYNPLARGHGQEANTSEEALKISFFGDHEIKIDLGPTANWTLRKFYDSVRGLVAKPWRNLQSFFGKSPGGGGHSSDSSQHISTDVNSEGGVVVSPLHSLQAIQSAFGNTGSTGGGDLNRTSQAASRRDPLERRGDDRRTRSSGTALSAGNFAADVAAALAMTKEQFEDETATSSVSGHGEGGVDSSERSSSILSQGDSVAVDSAGGGGRSSGSSQHISVAFDSSAEVESMDKKDIESQFEQLNNTVQLRKENFEKGGGEQKIALLKSALKEATTSRSGGHVASLGIGARAGAHSNMAEIKTALERQEDTQKLIDQAREARANFIVQNYAQHPTFFKEMRYDEPKKN